MAYDLLPSNATALERAFSLAMDGSERLSPAIDRLRTDKRLTIPDALLPFLVYEYGLGEASPYVPDLRRLLVTGIDWQRVRGSPVALDYALRWLNYSADLEEASPDRARWNLFQLGLSGLPRRDEDLDQIEAVAGLSVPARSQFWRGYRGYDVREAVYSHRGWSRAAWSASSGVRVKEGGAKWSFGRAHDFQYPLSQFELERLGAWVPYSPGATPEQEQIRRNAIVDALVGRSIYVMLISTGNQIIGYRRARCIHPVSRGDGEYRVGALQLRRDRIAPEGFYIEAITDFGDGAPQSAASLSLLWDGTPADATRPGMLWGGPDSVLGGIEVVNTSPPAPIELGRTTRERARLFLTF